MNKEKLKIIIGVGVVVTVMAISGFGLYKNMTSKDQPQISDTESQFDKDTNASLEENSDKTSLSQEELDKLTQEEKNKYAMGESYVEYQNAYKMGAINLPEYPKEESDVLYSELCNLAETANFQDIIDKVDSLKNKYKFHEDYNWRIGNVYLDATVIMSTQTVKVEQKGDMIVNLKDPNMLLIGTLLMPEKSRRDVIQDISSLSPIFEGKVDILTTEILKNDTEDSIGKSLFMSENSLKEVYKIDFRVEGYDLTAYIMKYENGSIAFKKIIGDSNTKYPFKTIEYWMSIDNEIYVNGDDEYNVKP